MSLNKIVFAKKSRFYLSKHDQVKPVFAFNFQKGGKMALYRYNARDRENRKYKGVKEAGSEAELVKALLEDGLYCCSLKNEERTASMKHFTVPLKLLPPLCSQVSSMLAAGVPQAEILKQPVKQRQTGK